MLIERLPLESATRTALRDLPPPEDVEPSPQPVVDDAARFGPWSLLNYQLAALTDAVKLAAYYSAAAVQKNPTVPQPTPRPGLRPLHRLSRAMAERLARLHP